MLINMNAMESIVVKRKQMSGAQLRKIKRARVEENQKMSKAMLCFLRKDTVDKVAETATPIESSRHVLETHELMRREAVTQSVHVADTDMVRLDAEAILDIDLDIPYAFDTERREDSAEEKESSVSATSLPMVSVKLDAATQTQTSKVDVETQMNQMEVAVQAISREHVADTRQETQESQFQDDTDIGRYNRHCFTDKEKKDILSKQWIPPHGFVFPKRNMQTGGRMVARQFNPKLLMDYKFARYSSSMDGVFCGPCFIFNMTNKASILVSAPLTDWSNCHKILKRHANSKEHLDAVTRGDAFIGICDGKIKTAYQALCDSDRKVHNRTRQAMKQIITVILMCGRQDIALRGRSSRKANFNVILQHFAALDPLLLEHLNESPRNAQYTSVQIQNELINLMGQQIQRKILKRVKNARWFSLIADGTTDISTKEQISLTVRYVHRGSDGDVEIHEDFIEFVEATDTTGKGLTEMFLQHLTAWGLDKELMRGQGYDQGSNMSGRFKGVQALIQEVVPDALYSICKAHSLNTAIVHSCALRPVANMFDTSRKVISILKSSAKWKNIYLAELNEFRNLPSYYDYEEDDNLHDRTTTIPVPGTTRWMSQADSMTQLKDKFVVAASTLEKIAEFDSEAHRCLTALTRFEFIVTLVAIEHILAFTKPLHMYLQTVNIDLIQAADEACLIVRALTRTRENVESAFHERYVEAKILADSVGVEESVPRTCGNQTQRGNIDAASPEEHFRRNIFVPFIDHVLSELKGRLIDCRPRFEAQYLIPRNVPLLVDEEDKVKQIYSAYKTDISSLEDLQRETARWCEKWVEMQAERCPDTIVGALQHLNPLLFPNINAALSILATMPVSVATAERSFSVLRRLKTWLRNSMGENRLTALALLNIHDDIPVDIEQVISDFDPCGDRRLSFVQR